MIVGNLEVVLPRFQYSFTGSLIFYWFLIYQLVCYSFFRVELPQVISTWYLQLVSLSIVWKYDISFRISIKVYVHYLVSNLLVREILQNMKQPLVPYFFASISIGVNLQYSGVLYIGSSDFVYEPLVTKVSVRVTAVILNSGKSE